jgi:hypothetical protein
VANTHLGINLGNLSVPILQNGIDGMEATQSSCKTMDIMWGMLANGNTTMITQNGSTGADGMKDSIGIPCMAKSLSQQTIVHVTMQFRF